jgi:hypothetical protein
MRNGARGLQVTWDRRKHCFSGDVRGETQVELSFCIEIQGRTLLFICLELENAMESAYAVDYSESSEKSRHMIYSNFAG